jgi:predicted metal-dependent HD superfamily phosphohydrolase
MADVDLSILGRAPEVFDAYEQAIRKEYAWVDDEQYNRARIEVLQSFLDRDRIYRTDVFAGLYEQSARENLSRSISRLERPPDH